MKETKKITTNSVKKTKGAAWDDVEILIVGAGIMGASLTQAYAQSGFEVGVVDVKEEILERALKTIESELEAGQEAGVFSEVLVEEIKRGIRATTSYEEACQGKNLKLVIETATEDIEIKKKIFRKLDELCAPHVVLASNSSSLDVNVLAGETNRTDKVVWMHYFYLPHKNRAGEYAGTDTASPESIETAAKYMKLAGKVVTPVLSSRKGGAADVIFTALLLEAARMVDEGVDIPSVEAAGKKAFNMPMGFLSLMDHNGIPLGIFAMQSFSDSSNPDDPLYKVYNNFFTPPRSYLRLFEKYEKAEDKFKIKWVSEEEAKKEPEDLMLVEVLKNRFLAVAFMTATEVVESGVIKLEEAEKLCQNAFLWREGPFTLMNKVGIQAALRIVTERMEISHSQGINFPISRLLIYQAQKNEPWPLKISPVIFSREEKRRMARIMISNPKAANALDNQVFEDLKTSFQKADQDEKVQVIVFDSAPIKTFIAGADVRDFIVNLKTENYQGLKEATALWQDVLFHEMTGQGKPKIAIVDGAALGGGAEVALAFALDPDSLVIATERTSYAFPETRLGIYPGLRGTLTLPQVIYKARGDAELALALSRYYILAGGIRTSSPRIVKYLGLTDFLVPARKRDEAAAILVEAIIDNGGKSLTSEQLESSMIEELPSELTPEEENELKTMKNLFSKSDLIPTLYSYAEGKVEIPFLGESKNLVEKIARWVTNNSPQAVKVAASLISKGFDDILKGKSLDEAAQYELDNHLVLTFQHPDALEGLTSALERREPNFKRR
jgi:enoyl-CoA hydratase/3-hydroxyacyl-CoA dehydrogenase